MVASLSMRALPQIRRGGVPLPPFRAGSIVDERSDAMPFIPPTMIGAGMVSMVLLVLLLLGDAAAPGRLSLALAGLLLLGGVVLVVGGMVLLEPRRGAQPDHRS
jgi:hypothetical protein